MGGNRKIGEYTLVAELHRSRTTTAYRGYQESLDRTVFVKVLNIRASEDPEIAHQFEREAQLVAGLQHPNIVSIFGFGRADDRAYYASEFVNGGAVKALLAQGPIPHELAAFILLETAKGLQAAHQKDILHRDIKPSNVMISLDGRVQVTDFGMASLNASDSPQGALQGTLGYIAPEDILGTPATIRSDLFALGVTFFEMLTGGRAFSGESVSELLDQTIHDEPWENAESDIELPAPLRRISQQLLKKKPEQRYQSTEILISDLEHLQKNKGPELVAREAGLRKFVLDPEAYRTDRVRRPPTDKHVRPTRAAKPRPPKKETPAEQPAPEKAPRNFKPALFGLLGIAILTLLALTAGNWLRSTNFSSGQGTGTGSEQGTSLLTSNQQGNPSSGGDTRSETSDSIDEEPAPEEENVTQETTPDEQPQNPPADPDSVSSAPAPATDAPQQEELATFEERLPDLPESEIKRGGPRPLFGSVLFDAVPWAAVFVNGDSIGVTPFPLDLPAGSHRVVFKNPDFPDYNSLIEVIAGQETPYSVSLWSRVGQLSVEVVPWAEVYIDGESRDQTPLEQPLIVSPGRHTLTLSHPELGRIDTAFEIEAGETRTLQFNMNTP